MNGKKWLAAALLLTSLCAALLSCGTTEDRQPGRTEPYEDTELSHTYVYYREAMTLLRDKLPVSEETAAQILDRLVEVGMETRLNYCVKVTDYGTGEVFYRLWWQDGEASLYLRQDGGVDRLFYQGIDLCAPDAPVPTTSAETTEADPTGTVYVLNTATGKFHLPSCRYAKQPGEAGYETAGSREEAVKKGCEPCKVCSP